jgi:hypothetical protein
MDQATDLTVLCLPHDSNKAYLFPNCLIRCDKSRYKLEFLWVRPPI